MNFHSKCGGYTGRYRNFYANACRCPETQDYVPQHEEHSLREQTLTEKMVVVGQLLAERIFKTWSRGKNVELHLSEDQLAAMLAVAAERGYNEGKKHR